MKIDQAATQTAQLRHAAGVAKLLELFGPDAALYLNRADRSGRWLMRLAHRDRQMVRHAKEAADPTYAARRKRRKAQRLARRRNR